MICISEYDTDQIPVEPRVSVAAKTQILSSIVGGTEKERGSFHLAFCLFSNASNVEARFPSPASIFLVLGLILNQELILKIERVGGLTAAHSPSVLPRFRLRSFFSSLVQVFLTLGSNF